MNAESKLSRLVLVSPWFLLFFLIVPVSVILSFTLQVRLPLVGPKLLLFNNACFAVLVACRFVRYLAGMRKSFRYGSLHGKPEQGETFPLPMGEARDAFVGAGYLFDDSGNYGEKREYGYLGTTLIYGGVLLLLLVGTADNMRQFSGTLLDGIGTSTKLSKIENYRSLSKGPLAAKTDSLPQMRITGQITPNDRFPKGATEALFLSPDGKELKALLTPGEPLPYGDYDIHMSRLIFEPQIVISTDKNQTVFSGFVKLHPMVRRIDGFGFFGPFAQGNLTGDVYYEPEKSRLKVVLRRDGKRVMNTEMVFQGERLVGQADLVLSCEKMGQWSEIRVVRRRHMPLLALGGAVALLGLLLRLAVAAQRVWLEPGAGGCLVRTTSRRESARVLGAARP